MDFRWNDWNEEHLAGHGVSPAEAEEVVLGARSPFPLVQGDEKYLVLGADRGGTPSADRFRDRRGELCLRIHGRPLTESKKKRYRRRKK